jgi:uncharacterized protein YdhG (YjbR/CyaY superfamily)
VSPTKDKQGFTAEEKAAMRARAKELKAAADGEEAIAAAFEKMAPADRALAEQIDALVRKTAPDLTPKTWYGMPAYANKDGKAICYFKDSGKFKARYSEFGFNEAANLDDGAMWPIVYALTAKLSKADETRIAMLVKQAASA